MHLEVLGSLSVDQGHFIADDVEATHGETLPDTEILIDPPSDKTGELTAKEV